NWDGFDDTISDIPGLEIKLWVLWVNWIAELAQAKQEPLGVKEVERAVAFGSRHRSSQSRVCPEAQAVGECLGQVRGFDLGELVAKTLLERCKRGIAQRDGSHTALQSGASKVPDYASTGIEVRSAAINSRPL